MLVCATAMADTYSYEFTKKVFDGNGTQNLDGVDWTVDTDGGYFGFDTSNNKKGQQFGSSKASATYLKVSTKGISGTITSIKVNTAGATDIVATLDVTVGGKAFGSQYTLVRDLTNVEFTGAASGEIVLSYANTSPKALYIKNIEVTYTADPNVIAVPTIEGSTLFETTADVTITGAEGTTIYYTLDGTEPTTSSAGGASPLKVTIDKTATLKAIAAKDGKVSAVTTKEFEKVAFTDATIASLNDMTESKPYVKLTLTNAKVTVIDGENVYVREGDKALMFYKSSLSFSANAVVNGTVKVDYDWYYGIHEVKENSFTTEDDLVFTESNEKAQPVNVSIDDILALKHVCDYVMLANVTITSEVSGQYTNYYANADGKKVQLFKGVDVSAMANDGKSYNIAALFNNIYKGAAELQPVEVSLATGIENIETGKADAKQVIYNMAGQRMEKMQKGLNIVNGKKVIKRQ